MSKQQPHIKRAARFLKLLSNVYRLKIVQQLENGEKNVNALIKAIDISQPLLSQHLAKLKREGVLDCRKDHREVFYFISNTAARHVLTVALATTSEEA